MKVASTAGVHEIGLTRPGSVRLNRHAQTGRIPLWLVRRQPGATEQAEQFFAGARRLADTIDQMNEMTSGKDETGVVLAEMVLANRIGAGGTQWVELAKQWLFQGARKDDRGGRYPEWVELSLATNGWDAVCRQPWETISGAGGLFEFGTHNAASITDLTVRQDVTVLGVDDDGVETYERWLGSDESQRRRIESERSGIALLDA